jgi:hypothetical protein
MIQEKQVAEFKSVRNEVMRLMMRDWETGLLVRALVSQNTENRNEDWSIVPGGSLIHNCMFLLSQSIRPLV